MNPLLWLQRRWFKAVHGRNLVYNTCWEDPRLDRQALALGPDDRVLVITSAGCNALDYLLEGPAEVFAVDVNPRQNALLELKVAGIRSLEFDDFFAIFGRGRHPQFRSLYESRLRNQLTPFARKYWDRHWKFFRGQGRRKSFYFRGSSGFVAWVVNSYIDRIAKVRPAIDAVLNAESISEQRDIYHTSLKDAFWNRFIRWAVGRDSTLAMLGVPREQRLQVELDYPGRIAKFIEDAIEAVFCDLPLKDNYFWRVYLTGEYTQECCPEYLKRSNFDVLKAGLVDRLRIETSTVLEFLRNNPSPISRFVLLDHMDWMSNASFESLEQEWQAILDRATPGARLLWRSGGLRTEYLDHVTVGIDGRSVRLPELLDLDMTRAKELHRQDRVHTYGSFYVANLTEDARLACCA